MQMADEIMKPRLASQRQTLPAAVATAFIAGGVKLSASAGPAAKPVLAAGLGLGALCLAAPFPTTNLVDDSPLLGACAFAGVAAWASAQPKSPAMAGVTLAGAALSMGSLYVLGLSTDEMAAKADVGTNLKVDILRASEKIDRQKSNLLEKL